MKLWHNGRIKNEEEAVIPVSDHGFLYGMGLFETFRTYNGQPFLLARHLERLAEGCDELRIAYSPQEKEVRRITADLLEANGLTDAYFRLSVSAGPALLGLPGAAGYQQPNVLIYVKELPPLPPDPAERAKSLTKLATARTSPESGIRRKSFHYMNNILGKWELLSRPEAARSEGLFLNEAGYITEGIVSNVFFIHGSVLSTPAIETGCLPGITRDFVMELAGQAGLQVEEGLYKWEQLLQADEIFYTNSIQEIVPVVSLIDDQGQAKKVSGGKPGRYTVRLLDQYKDACRLRANT